MGCHRTGNFGSRARTSPNSTAIAALSTAPRRGTVVFHSYRIPVVPHIAKILTIIYNHLHFLFNFNLLYRYQSNKHLGRSTTSEAIWASIRDCATE